MQKLWPVKVRTTKTVKNDHDGGSGGGYVDGGGGGYMAGGGRLVDGGDDGRDACRRGKSNMQRTRNPKGTRRYDQHATRRCRHALNIAKTEKKKCKGSNCFLEKI